MAAITHGPRLGQPSPSGFSLWLRADGAATVALETRLSGAVAWVAQSTGSIDLAQGNTVVLTASGLDATTLYEYRVLLDGVQAHTSSTMTMPPATGGRFVCYHTSDGHTTTQAAYDFIRSHWEANYEPESIPAFILQTGDLYEFDAAVPDAATGFANEVLPEIAELSGASRATERIPMVYMWDDWDFAGNNSAGVGNVLAFGGSLADAQAIWDWTWRDHPQPTAPSRTYSFEIAGVPWVVVDQRSQRTQSGAHPGIADGRTGDEPLQSHWTAVGVPQRAWLITELQRVSTRGVVFCVNGTTVVDGAHVFGTNGAGSAVRDSVGLWHKAERNHVLLSAFASVLDKRNLVLLTGDDHRSSVFTRRLGIPAPVQFGGSGEPIRGNPTELFVREFKVSSRSGAPVGQTRSIFGEGELFEKGDDANAAVLVWDITSARSGEHVTARARFLASDLGGAVFTSTAGMSAGMPGDLWYENGYCGHYADRAEPSQIAPGDTLPGGVTFSRGYVDDLHGTVHRRRYLDRDYLNRLHRADDHDDLDSAELRAITQIRRENPPRVPS